METGLQVWPLVWVQWSHQQDGLQGLLDCPEQDWGEVWADCFSAAPSGAEGAIGADEKNAD